MPLRPSDSSALPPSPPPSPPVISSLTCPYNCFDELHIGAFKGFFAGTLWGAYSLYRNLHTPTPTPLSPLPIPIPQRWAPRPLRVVSSALVYPVKFAGLVGVYRLLMCSACHLSSPSHSPLDPLWAAPLSASLAGLVVSLPHLNVGVSMRTMAGCGMVGAVVGAVGVGRMTLQEWMNDSERGAQGHRRK